MQSNLFNHASLKLEFLELLNKPKDQIFEYHLKKKNVYFCRSLNFMKIHSICENLTPKIPSLKNFKNLIQVGNE